MGENSTALMNRHQYLTQWRYGRANNTCSYPSDIASLKRASPRLKLYLTKTRWTYFTYPQK